MRIKNRFLWNKEGSGLKHQQFVPEGYSSPESDDFHCAKSEI